MMLPGRATPETTDSTITRESRCLMRANNANGNTPNLT